MKKGVVMRSIAVIFFLIFSSSSPAFSQGWDCRHRVDFPDGWSVMDQLYFDSGPADIGPIFHISRKGFYANWHPNLKTFNAPFEAPGLLSFDMDAPGNNRKGNAIFTAVGQKPVHLSISASGPNNGRRPSRILFQPKDSSINRILLLQQHWQIAVFDRRGKKTAQLEYRFPYNLSDLAGIYTNHVAAIQKMALTKEQECGDAEEYKTII
jgi:hypothetical protein